VVKLAGVGSLRHNRCPPHSDPPEVRARPGPADPGPDRSTTSASAGGGRLRRTGHRGQGRGIPASRVDRCSKPGDPGRGRDGTGSRARSPEGRVIKTAVPSPNPACSQWTRGIGDVGAWSKHFSAVERDPGNPLQGRRRWLNGPRRRLIRPAARPPPSAISLFSLQHPASIPKPGMQRRDGSPVRPERGEQVTGSSWRARHAPQVFRGTTWPKTVRPARRPASPGRIFTQGLVERPGAVQSPTLRSMIGGERRRRFDLVDRLDGTRTPGRHCLVRRIQSTRSRVVLASPVLCLQQPSWKIGHGSISSNPAGWAVAGADAGDWAKR